MLNNYFLKYKESVFFILGALLFFILTLSFKYYQYQQFKSQTIYESHSYVAALYDDNKTLKLVDKQFTFYTSIKNHELKFLDNVTIVILTQNVNFKDFLGGFFAKSYLKQNLQTKHNETLFTLFQYINNTHKNEDIASFFNGLFFGISLTQAIQTQSINLGILHLIALSGFHLSVIATIIYFSAGQLYKLFHNQYFPYRNYKFDILVFTCFILFGYVLLVGFIPSLIRSFVMFLVAIFLLRQNIKLLSYTTLAYVCLALIALFPELIFSIGFWFSVFGIFYIYLYLQYFSKLNKIVSFGFFNIWLFLVMNVVVHYFFGNTSIHQLLSPIITIMFIPFFPLEILLHTLNLGGSLDFILEWVLELPTTQYNRPISFAIFIATITSSIGAIFHRFSFYVLNAIIIMINIWLFIKF